VVLGGNAVYETDESLSGSAYVIGGHLSRVEGGWTGRPAQPVSAGPLFFCPLAVLVLLLLPS
jgi:hypothetical protein